MIVKISPSPCKASYILELVGNNGVTDMSKWYYGKRSKQSVFRAAQRWQKILERGTQEKCEIVCQD